MGLLDRFRRRATMDISAAARAADRGQVLLIDVRSRREFSSRHALSARNVPLPILASHLDTLSAKGKPVAFICQSGARSAKAARLARVAGLHARSVRGGMAAWDRAGLPGVGGGRRR